MIKVPIYLYNNSVEILLDLDLTGRTNNIMYQRDIILQRGLKNSIQLQFKNSDQKLMNVSSSTFVFSMFGVTDQRILVEKPVEIIDDGVTTAKRGLAQVTFFENDTLGLEAVYYSFSVKHVDSAGSFEPTYSNTYYGASGTIRLRQDVEPVLRPTTTITSFQQVYNPDIGSQQYEWYSGNLDAHPEFKNSASLQTCALYMTAFRGTVLIQGTLENTPGTFGNYALIESRSYSQFTGIDYVNFQGMFSKIRVKYIPSQNPGDHQNNDTAYTGTVDKLLYRS